MVERKVASIDATLEPSEEKGGISDNCEKNRSVNCHIREARRLSKKVLKTKKSSLRRGTIGTTNVHNQIRRQEQKEDLIRQVQEATGGGCQHDKEMLSRAKLIHLDFQDIDTVIIGDNSIDLIFTDPPYHKQWLPLYEPLGKLAGRVLKERGVYAGLVRITTNL
ncbi:MAG: hypothetical protein WA667_27240 [Candidatus Nitrosopolaris sp.]